MTGNKFRCCRNGSAGRASYMADNMVCDGCPPESSCSFFIRKPSGYPKASCFSLHFFLDWLFIFPLRMGLKGAAVASGLGQVLSFVILISYFVRKKDSSASKDANFHLRWLVRYANGVCRNVFPS